MNKKIKKSTQKIFEMIGKVGKVSDTGYTQKYIAEVTAAEGEQNKLSRLNDSLAKIQSLKNVDDETKLKMCYEQLNQHTHGHSVKYGFKQPSTAERLDYAQQRSTGSMSKLNDIRTNRKTSFDVKIKQMLELFNSKDSYVVDHKQKIHFLVETLEQEIKTPQKSSHILKEDLNDLTQQGANPIKALEHFAKEGNVNACKLIIETHKSDKKFVQKSQELYNNLYKEGKKEYGKSHDKTRLNPCVTLERACTAEAGATQSARLPISKTADSKADVRTDFHLLTMIKNLSTSELSKSDSKSRVSSPNVDHETPTPRRP